uniref:Uncharacterized protein n=1 Tax=Glossina palpalis gambiensis TaxID=67801 RepID=A0A1B0BF18_9MUSC
MDDQTELKTGVDAVQCSTKKLDKALLALKVRRTVTEQQIDRVNDFVKHIQEDSSGVSLDELNIRLKALGSAFDAFNKVQTKIKEKDFDEVSQPNRSKCEELYSNNVERRCQILESNLSSVSLPGGAPTSRAIEPKRVQRTAKSFVTIKNCCSFCQKPGQVIYRFSDFLSLSTADRLNKVRALKLCVNCLKFKNHNLSDCTSKGRCHTCGRGHHSLLHFERPQVANYTASKHNQINETSHIEPAENANHNMSDQPQPKNVAALKKQHTERNTLTTAIVYIISPTFPLSCSIGWWFTN